MKLNILGLAFFTFVCVSLNASADNSMLRLACDGDSIGAGVSINGQFKGDCPVDVQVPPGIYQVKAQLPVDKYNERVFEQTIRIGDSSVKRIDIQLGAARLNADGQLLENERLAKERKAAQLVEDKNRQVRLARESKFQAILDMAIQQGAAPNNAKSFHQCSGCPEIVLVKNESKGVIVGIGKFDVTRGQYRQFVEETGRNTEPGCMVFQDPGFWGERYNAWQIVADQNWTNPGFIQGDDHPVVCVSLKVASDYATWLSFKTKHHYFLLSANWYLFLHPNFPNYASICQFANLRDQQSLVRAYGVGNEKYPCNDGFAYTSPVGTFPADEWGIYDFFGNVDQIVPNSSSVISLYGGSWATRKNTLHTDYAEMNDSDRAKDGYADIRFFVGKTMPRSDVGFRIMTDFEPL